MKIGFVDYILDPKKPGRSGLSDMVWDMASELIKQGHEVHVIASYHTKFYPDPLVKMHNFKTPPIGYRNIIGQLWILVCAAKIVKKLHLDVVHAPEYVSTAVLATYGVNCPIVLTVPGNIFYRLSRNNGMNYEWSYTQVLKWAARKSARRCDKVIAISNDMKRWWEWTGSPPENTPMIPLGSNPSRFYRVASARKILKLEDKFLTLLYVGRFELEKGIYDIIEAICLLSKEYPDLENRLRVHLIGRGPLEGEMKNRIDSLGLSNIIIVRSWVQQDDLPIWYSAADALLLASSAEGFSRTIPEAMSCGTPVIGSAISGTEDHIQAGINGFLFPSGDARALANILSPLIQNPDSIRLLRARTEEYAKSFLQWPNIMKKIVNEVYGPIAMSRA